MWAHFGHEQEEMRNILKEKDDQYHQLKKEHEFNKTTVSQKGQLNEGENLKQKELIKMITAEKEEVISFGKV